MEVYRSYYKTVLIRLRPKIMQKMASRHGGQVQSVQVIVSWVQKQYTFFGLKTI